MRCGTPLIKRPNSEEERTESLSPIQTDFPGSNHIVSFLFRNFKYCLIAYI